MPINIKPEDTREISLRRWRVMEIESPDGKRSRHVWGHDVKSGRGRASSPIQEFDLQSMIAVTRSGSSYKLVGLPGNSRLGKGAWGNWCKTNAVVAELDVTSEYVNIDQLSTVDLTRFTRIPD